jgi:hypothetical protein
VEIDLSSLLTKILEETVKSFAETMTPPGGNKFSMQAALFRAVRDACDTKAEIAEGLSSPQPAAETESERARRLAIEEAEERDRQDETHRNRRKPKKPPLYPV